MRVFVTGASGWIGSAVVTDLLAGGHTVLGLARSDTAAEKVAAAGAEVLRGDVTDLDTLRAGAEQADAVVHLAFRHDVAFGGDFGTAVDSDRAAIDTLGAALAGTGRPLAIASGTATLGEPGRVTTERDLPEPPAGERTRTSNERVALALAERGIRAMSVRFAPTVHGDGDYGFMRMVADADRAHGRAGYVGDGEQRWPAVHRDDAGRLVRLAIEQAPAGSVLHAIAEEGVRTRDVAEAMARALDVPAVSLTPEQADQQFGFLGPLLARDMPASSAITRELLGWTPTGPGLLTDLAQGHYVARQPTAPSAH